MYAVEDKPSRTRKYPSQLLKSYGPVNADQKKEYLARAPMTTRASQIWQEETSQATSTMRCHVCKAEYTTLKASSLVSCQDASRRIRCLSRGVNTVYWKIYWSLWCRAAKPLISLLLRRSIQQRTCSSLQRAEEQVYPCRDEAPPNVTETFSWHETLNTTRKYRLLGETVDSHTNPADKPRGCSNVRCIKVGFLKTWYFETKLESPTENYPITCSAWDMCVLVLNVRSTLCRVDVTSLSASQLLAGVASFSVVEPQKKIRETSSVAWMQPCTQTCQTTRRDPM